MLSLFRQVADAIRSYRSTPATIEVAPAPREIPWTDQLDSASFNQLVRSLTGLAAWDRSKAPAIQEQLTSAANARGELITEDIVKKCLHGTFGGNVTDGAGDDLEANNLAALKILVHARPELLTPGMIDSRIAITQEFIDRVNDGYRPYYSYKVMDSHSAHFANEMLEVVPAQHADTVSSLRTLLEISERPFPGRPEKSPAASLQQTRFERR